MTKTVRARSNSPTCKPDSFRVCETEVSSARRARCKCDDSHALDHHPKNPAPRYSTQVFQMSFSNSLMLMSKLLARTSSVFKHGSFSPCSRAYRKASSTPECCSKYVSDHFLSPRNALSLFPNLTFNRLLVFPLAMKRRYRYDLSFVTVYRRWKGGAQWQDANPSSAGVPTAR